MLGTITTRLVLLGLAAATLIACAPAMPSPSESPDPSPDSTATGSSTLVVTITDGSGPATVWRLTCDPPGGDHPDPAAACRALAEHPRSLRPGPKNRACAQVYGGPQRATISGTWQGEPILASFSRTDACETGRWDSLVGLLPPGGA